VQVNGATVVIAVKYPFHKERLDEQANRLTLATAFDSILGSKTRLSIIVEGTPLPVSAPVDVPLQAAVAPSEHPLENPLVNQAMELLGGKLVEEA
jgi:hypothetical protein